MLICVNRLSIVFIIKYSVPNQIIKLTTNKASIVAIKYFTIYLPFVVFVYLSYFNHIVNTIQALMCYLTALYMYKADK